jgi:hypothetical protein
MPIKDVTSVQKRSEPKNQEDGSGKRICTGCQAVMSRRSLKKPDSETGLSEVTYRCPKCGVTSSRWMSVYPTG